MKQSESKMEENKTLSPLEIAEEAVKAEQEVLTIVEQKIG